jgi:D-arabinose 1-dehydrogenase-like Zn-dependent alcohol dehydrogenase
MGVQILRAVSAARLVAADINEAKLEFARKHGAVATVNTRSENAAEEILAVRVAEGQSCLLSHFLSFLSLTEDVAAKFRLPSVPALMWN